MSAEEQVRAELAAKERDREDAEADEEFSNYCCALGGGIVRHQDPVGEVRTRVSWVYQLPKGHTLTVTRAWAYLSATIEPALPCKFDSSVGYRLNETLYRAANPTRYSGGEWKLGAVCRAQGFGGGLFGQRLLDFCRGGVDRWHIDDRAALGTFVSTLTYLLDRT